MRILAYYCIVMEGLMNKEGSPFRRPRYAHLVSGMPWYSLVWAVIMVELTLSYACQ